jgi:hypothetical protein
MGRSAADLVDLDARVRPVVLAGERVLPVLPALEGLLPAGRAGLRRGSTVTVGGEAGATSLALALLAGPSAAGSWAAVAGLPTVGLAAAAGFGVALERVVLVGSTPTGAWGTVVATLVDAFDIVLARTGPRLRLGDARRLAARARERGSVLIMLGAGDDNLGSDLRFTVVDTAWEGLEDGHGHLRARRVTVEVGGRRGADRPRRVDLWLPTADGSVATVEQVATVRRLGAVS